MEEQAGRSRLRRELPQLDEFRVLAVDDAGVCFYAARLSGCWSAGALNDPNRVGVSVIRNRTASSQRSGNNAANIAAKWAR